MLYQAWNSESGGKDPAAAYRRYVAEGLKGGVENPLKSALREWVIGSQDFLKRMVALAEGGDELTRSSITRRMSCVTMDQIIHAVAAAHEVEPWAYVGFRCMAPGREMAALLCRRYSSATLAELSAAFGLSHPDSSANLVRRAKQRARQSGSYRKRLKQIESRLVKTDKQV